MRKVTVALGSFALGVVTASLLGLGTPHTSTLLHPFAFAQERRPAEAIDRPAARPVVPTVGLWTLDGVTTGAAQILDLDGLDCINCTLLDGGIVAYAGGPFKIEHLSATGHLNVTLFGPALNTANLLSSFGLIGCPVQQRQEPINPDRPTLQTASFKAGTILNLSSPVGIKP